MTIGIDFDNTIVNTKEVSKKYLDIFMPGNTLNSYHDLDNEEALRFAALYFKQITDDLKLLPGVKEAFEYFKKHNIKTVLITARGIDYEYLIKPTKEFLKRNNIEFDVLEFGCYQKEEACQRNKIDLMIDDISQKLDGLKKLGIKTLLFGRVSNDYPYALNWQEVLNFIKGGLKCE